MRFRVFVSGTVQGVGFRAYTQRVANELGLRGWVRNLPDGRVEILVEGDEEVLCLFIKEVWKGPKLASVERIELLREVSDEPLTGFSIKH